MASPGRLGSEDLISLGDQGDDDGFLEASDPAGTAARLVAEEVVSILQAVEARTAQIEAMARREAEAIRRAAARAGEDAAARFGAITRELDALMEELGEREARRRDGH